MLYLKLSELKIDLGEKKFWYEFICPYQVWCDHV